MKILIAEDDSSLRRALTLILQKNNYSVDAVDNGGDALAYLFQFAFAYCQQAQIRFLADLRLLSFAFQFAAKAFAVSAPSSS